jgi:predicted flap endonuclease-1-like 5' DNA nuclease
LIPSLACSLARLADAGVTSFANNAAWEAHLDQLGNHRARKRGRSSRCRLTALRGIGPLRVPILCRSPPRGLSGAASINTASCAMPCC